jgi:hypothetical protein
LIEECHPFRQAFNIFGFSYRRSRLVLRTSHPATFRALSLGSFKPFRTSIDQLKNDLQVLINGVRPGSQRRHDQGASGLRFGPQKAFTVSAKKKEWVVAMQYLCLMRKIL